MYQPRTPKIEELYIKTKMNDLQNFKLALKEFIDGNVEPNLEERMKAAAVVAMLTEQKLGDMLGKDFAEYTVMLDDTIEKLTDKLFDTAQEGHC